MAARTPEWEGDIPALGGGTPAWEGGIPAWEGGTRVWGGTPVLAYAQVRGGTPARRVSCGSGPRNAS